jgi:hypothetical protein
VTDRAVNEYSLKHSCSQVVQELQALLLTRGYKFDFRGVVSVKGKGSLITYFVQDTPKSTRSDIQLD